MSRISYMLMIAVVVLLLIGGVVGYFFIQSNNNGTSIIQTAQNYFPFGRGGTPVSPPAKTQPDQTNTTPTQTEPQQVNTNKRLVQISTNPVAGYTFFVKNIPKDKTNLPQPTVTTINPIGTFTRNLRLGSNNADVKALEQTLNQCPTTRLAFDGAGSPGNETNLYTKRTVDAVKRFQQMLAGQILTPYGKTTGSGVFDTVTRNIASQPFSCIIGDTLGDTIATPAVRYTERATGNIFDFLSAVGTTSRQTNTTIPRIYQATFVQNATGVIYRYVGDDNHTIQTWFARIPETIDTDLTGSFLSQNIVDMVSSPDTSRILGITSTTNSTRITASDPDGSNSVQLFSSPYSEWLLQWFNKNAFTVTTKASSVAPGYAYMINTITKNTTKLLGGITGLTTTTSPDGTYILYSQSVGQGFTTALYNTKTHTTTNTIFTTLPDKCAWSADSQTVYCGVPYTIDGSSYPDAWYQGTVSFSDKLISVSMKDMSITPLPFDTDGTFDITQIQTDATQTYLGFINKKDMTLWQYKLKI